MDQINNNVNNAIPPNQNNFTNQTIDTNIGNNINPDLVELENSTANVSHTLPSNTINAAPANNSRVKANIQSWPQVICVKDVDYIIQRPSTKEVWKVFVRYQSVIENISKASTEEDVTSVDGDGLIDVADEILKFAKINNSTENVSLDYFDLGDDAPFILCGEISVILFSDFLEGSLKNEVQPLEHLFRPLQNQLEK